MAPHDQRAGDDRACDCYLHRSLYHRAVAEKEEAFVIESLRPRQGRVLEVGPGSGRMTRHLALLADALTVCDLRPEVLCRVEARLGPQPHVSYRPCELERLESVPGYGDFDAAVAVRVVPFANDWRLGAKKLCRAVRPGGLAIFDLWNRHSFVGAMMKLFPRPEPVAVHRPTRVEIRDALAELPAQLISAYRWGYPRVGAFHLDDLGACLWPSWAYATLFCLRC